LSSSQIQNQNYINYIIAIIRSEALCQETLLKDKQNCTAQIRALEEKAKLAQLQQESLKIACNKDKEALLAEKVKIEAENKKCNMEKLSLFGEHQLVVNELQQVRDLCARLDKDQLSAKVEQIWRESLLYRNLDSIPFYYSPEVEKVMRHCRELPRIVLDRIESLARELKAGIDQVTRENAELQRQKEANAKSLVTCKEEKEKATKETQERLQKLQEDCVKQGRLALEEKAALQREKEALIKEIEQKKGELILVKGQLDINKATLDTCIKTKAQGLPTIQRPPGPAVSPTRIDPAGLEEFKKKVLELYQKANVPPGNPAR
ncbi:plasmalemma vesicle-associated protein, partial [Gracilinanus agilis]|uniref:plasmalemma vesicle-associated protein n=1 Tax=Gracilinanus agilis TaxID=191870 RepID=UPI001CFE2A31